MSYLRDPSVTNNEGSSSKTKVMNIKKPPLKSKVEFDSLFEILKYKRKAKTWGEAFVIEKHLDTVEGMKCDGYGNRYITIGENPTTMFSSHTDTVHKTIGTQVLRLDSAKYHLFVKDSECLGADDGAGMWMMLQMIKNDVKGLYVFHREEEIGGHGSHYIVSKTPELVKGIKRCIAFDRKGYTDVITEQFGVCCSQDFALALGQAINADHKGLQFVPSDLGVFTDSANYVGLIPECTNLSVGYFHQHSKSEYLDLAFIKVLLESCIRLDWESLPTVKKVEEETQYYGSKTKRATKSYLPVNSAHSKGRNGNKDYDYDDYYDSYDTDYGRMGAARTNESFSKAPVGVAAQTDVIAEAAMNGEVTKCEALCIKYPRAASLLICDLYDEITTPTKH